jgi:opacity protein-like surface antigen
LILGIAWILGIAGSAAAQEGRSQISLGATGVFTRSIGSERLQYEATRSAGLHVAYLYNLNRSFGVEGRYAATLNTQNFANGPGQTFIRSDVREATAAAVIKAPVQQDRLHLFGIAGGGVLIFRPTDLAPTNSDQSKGALVYGGGMDMDLAAHLGVRFEYRGLIYKAPDFKQTELRLDRFTHMAEPSVGIYFRF